MAMSDIDELMAMLSYRRASATETEEEYIHRFLVPLGVKSDAHGNFWMQIGERPTVLWSSHTDSVHSSGGTQRIKYENDKIRLHKKSKSGCLGADDAAGNWIMMHMIRANIQGLYVFHHAEEMGGIGSNAIAKKTPEFLDGIEAAIAFDRRGTTDIITHQGGERTCSDAFANSLAAQLKGFSACDLGIFTDTRVYKSLIPECTNISVGYEREHSSEENLDVNHLIGLRDQMLKIDVSGFKIERDPKVIEHKKYTSTWKGSNYGPSTYKGKSYYSQEPSTMSELLWRWPEDAARVIENAGMEFEDFLTLAREAREKRHEAIRFNNGFEDEFNFA